MNNQPSWLTAFPLPPSFLQRSEVERALTESQRDKFENMLRGLTLERAQIKEAMAFALDNAEAAGEVWCMISLLTLYSHSFR